MRKEMRWERLRKCLFYPGSGRNDPDAHVYVVGDPASVISQCRCRSCGKGSYKIASLRKLGLTRRDKENHHDPHHSITSGALRRSRRRFPRWNLVTAGSGAAEEGDDRTVYVWICSKDVQMQYGLKPGAFTFAVDRKLEGGELLEVGNMVWEVVHIPATLQVDCPLQRGCGNSHSW